MSGDQGQAGRRGLGSILGLDVELDEDPPQAPPPQAAPAGFPVRTLVLATRRYAWFALAVGAVVVAAGGLVVQRKFRPVYRAEATLFVRPTAPSLAYTGEEWRAESIVGFYGDYVRTLKAIATEHGLLTEVIAFLDEEGVSWRHPAVSAAAAPAHLRARLEVRHVRDSYLLNIGIEDADPAVTAPIVNAVAHALIDAQALEQRADAEGRLATLDQERERLAAMLRINQAEIDTLSADAGLAVLDERQNVFYERLIRLQDGVTKVYVERVRAEAELDVERSRAEVLRGPVPKGKVLRLLDEDTVIQDARLMFERLVREVNDETGDLAPSHPSRAQGLARIQAAEESLRSLETATTDRLQRRLALEGAEEAQRIEDEARRRLDAAIQGEAEMAVVVREAEAELETYSRSVQHGMALRAESERLLAAIERVDGRIEELVVESKAPGRISMRSEGVVPTRPTGDRRRLLLLMVLFAGFIAGPAAALGLQLALGAWSRRDELLRPQVATE